MTATTKCAFTCAGCKSWRNVRVNMRGFGYSLILSKLRAVREVGSFQKIICS
eukprot:COSAG02_NODE_2615_length_8414_cov_2.406374_7_plen_52_part_00